MVFLHGHFACDLLWVWGWTVLNYCLRSGNYSSELELRAPVNNVTARGQKDSEEESRA